jgi:hypothetical protein
MLEIGQQVYFKDTDIFCVSLLATVLAIDVNLVTVKTGVRIKGQNIFTVRRDKVYLDEKQLKSKSNPAMGEAMDKMKQVFERMAR